MTVLFEFSNLSELTWIQLIWQLHELVKATYKELSHQFSFINTNNLQLV